MKLYKYVSSKYLDSIIKEGRIRFNSLRYYRSIEDNERRDENEGNLKYKPQKGLELNFLDGREGTLYGSFDSSINDKDIFVFCLSTKLCPNLAKKFKVDCCIEISKSDRVFAKINKEIKNRHSDIKPNKIFRDRIVYYNENDLPLHYWALPQQIVLRKKINFQLEYEYRIFFSFNNALDFGNTKQVLTTEEFKKYEKIEENFYQINIGNISQYTKIHKFKKE